MDLLGMLHCNCIVSNTCPKWQIIFSLPVLFSVDVYVTFTIVMILLKMSCSLEEDSNAFLLAQKKTGKLSLLSYSHWKTLDPSWPPSFILVSPSESCYQNERKKKKRLRWVWVFIRCLFFWRGVGGLGDDFSHENHK